MKDWKDLLNYLDKITQNEIQKLRSHKKVDDYLFKSSEKIFKKIAYPYFRFEILLKCLADVKINYKKHYSEVDIKQINIVSNKLEKICLYLNIALDEYNNMLSYINKKRCAK